MVALSWDDPDDRTYQYGVDRGVLYTGPDRFGVAWNGLVDIQDSWDGGQRTPLYLDGRKYLDSVSSRTYMAEVTALTFPRELFPCLGWREVRPGFILTGQPKETFHLAFRTKTSDDGYKIHTVFNATLTPIEKSHNTIGQVTDPTLFRWKLECVPPSGFGAIKPAVRIIEDSRYQSPGYLELYEDLLYGTSTTEPQLPV